MGRSAVAVVMLGVALLPSSPTLEARADTPLLDAVKNHDDAAVEALLTAGVDVDAAQPDGATALHWAVHLDDAPIVERLILAGATVDATNEYGVTPLSVACSNGSVALVERLLEAGADPNRARPTGETPLMRAASTGSVRAVEALVAHGADVNRADPERGQTPLMWAIWARRPAVAARLIAHGADVLARSTGGFTPLLFAAREGDSATTRSLLAAGADVHDAMEDGTSALHVATVRGHVGTAILLLEHGADPNAAGPGYTPLHWAAGSWQTELSGPNGIATDRDDEWRGLRGVPGDRAGFVRALLDHGADPDARLERVPPRAGYSQLRVEHRVAGVSPFPGATPFLLAAMAADVEVMRVLAEAGADPNRTADDGTTPLMLAVGLGRYMAETLVTEARSLEAAVLAIELGADVDAANETGSTALHGAAHLKSDALVRLLVQHGASLDPVNARGQTPLAVAELSRAGSATTPRRSSTGDLLRALGARPAPADPPPR